MEAVPLASVTTDDCAWCSRHCLGRPLWHTNSHHLVQRPAIQWHSLCETISIKHIPTTAYHPEGNGQVKRLYPSLKDALCARCIGLDWPNHLP